MWTDEFVSSMYHFFFITSPTRLTLLGSCFFVQCLAPKPPDSLIYEFFVGQVNFTLPSVFVCFARSLLLTVSFSSDLLLPRLSTAVLFHNFTLCLYRYICLCMRVVRYTSWCIISSICAYGCFHRFVLSKNIRTFLFVSH